jgi:hypothetical protein
LDSLHRAHPFQSFRGLVEGAITGKSESAMWTMRMGVDLPAD